jgi:curved DNA-binding protein CbpA
VDNIFTYYDLLGVRPDASMSAIQNAYRAAMRQYHPDVNAAPNAQQITAMLNRAYNVLSDPRQRAEYDREIGVRSGPTNAGRSQSAGPAGSSGQDFRRSTATTPVDHLWSVLGRLVPRVVGGVAVLVVGAFLVGVLLHLLPVLLALAVAGVVVRGLLRLIA